MPYLFWSQKVKGQGHNALIIGNGLSRIISFPLHLSSWNFTHRLPMSRGYALLILGSKGQRSRSQCIDYRKQFMSHNFFLFKTYHHETSHTDSPWVEDVPYLFWGQKVKGQGHNALIIGNGLCRIISFPLHLSPWNFTHRLPMSRGYALLILGSKGQRSRSQCIDYRKRFMSHTFFPFTPIIMKLHTQTPHESRMCPIYFGVKRSKVKVTMHLL